MYFDPARYLNGGNLTALLLTKQAIKIDRDNLYTNQWTRMKGGLESE